MQQEPPRKTQTRSGLATQRTDLRCHGWLLLRSNLSEDCGENHFIGIEVTAFGLKLDHEFQVVNPQYQQPRDDQEIQIIEPELDCPFVGGPVGIGQFFPFDLAVFFFDQVLDFADQFIVRCNTPPPLDAEESTTGEVERDAINPLFGVAFGDRPVVGIEEFESKRFETGRHQRDIDKSEKRSFHHDASDQCVNLGRRQGLALWKRRKGGQGPTTRVDQSLAGTVMADGLRRPDSTLPATDWMWYSDQLVSPPAGPLMKPIAARLFCVLLAVGFAAHSGCRAIRRFGESRQSIAARRLSGQGFQAMHDGRWDIAESLFTDALDASKADDRAHWGLAESYWNRGEQELAIEHMEQAVRLSAGDPKFVERLGRMYLDLGRSQEADQHSLWALQTKRDSPDAWRLRGDCLRASGKDDEALAAYHRALALQPDYPQVQLQAAEIYRSQRRFDRLLATLDRLQDGVGIEDAPAQVDLLQGIAMRQLGRPNEARRCFVRASEKEPLDATPHLELASLALERGEIDGAREALAVALRLNPDSVRDGGWMEQLRNEQERLAREPNDVSDSTIR